jgi:nucleoid-associated protein YgaU
VRAIFEVNRTAMESPDDLVVGRSILLPPVDGSAPAGPDGAPAQATVVVDNAPRSSSSPTYRLYKVKKGDLLGTIAQEQLGSAKRWQEILALNRDVCKDARRLPCGVEIRIPVDTLADAR